MERYIETSRRPSAPVQSQFTQSAAHCVPQIAWKGEDARRPTYRHVGLHIWKGTLKHHVGHLHQSSFNSQLIAHCVPQIAWQSEDARKPTYMPYLLPRTKTWKKSLVAIFYIYATNNMLTSSTLTAQTTLLQWSTSGYERQKSDTHTAIGGWDLPLMATHGPPVVHHPFGGPSVWWATTGNWWPPVAHHYIAVCMVCERRDRL